MLSRVSFLHEYGRMIFIFRDQRNMLYTSWVHKEMKMDVSQFLKNGKFNSNSSWLQWIFYWWIKLSLLDKILFYLLCASFFVIVIPSILNDFFYASIYFTDFSIGFSIILLFFCVFWLGYFSGHEQNGELKKIENSEKVRKPNRGAILKKAFKKSKKLKGKFLRIKRLPSGFYSLLVFYLQRKMSPKLVLFFCIHHYSKKNVKARENDVKSYTLIKNMPNLLPLKERRKILSYSSITKKMKDEKNKPRPKKLPESQAIIEKTGQWI